MAFIKSVLFGSEGSYNFLGVPVTFQNGFPPGAEPPSLEGAGIVSRIANGCINSQLFHLLSFGYVHVFVHEMGHAVTTALLTWQVVPITVFTSVCRGLTDDPRVPYSSHWKHTIVSVAGPVADIAFSIGLIAAAVAIVALTALESYIAWPIALILGGSGVFWICGELLYAVTSVVNGDNGDFGSIAMRSGGFHLALATATVVAELALGAFAVMTLLA